MSQPSSSTELNYAIAGMDSAECARKIEGVVNKTPGASNPKVNFTAEKLSLHLDESITPRAELERRIAAIGYKPTLAAGHGPAIERDHAGHDHAGHEGHDHSSHDDHSGHDHNKHEGEIAATPGFDPHAGHDHARAIGVEHFLDQGLGLNGDFGAALGDDKIQGLLANHIAILGPILFFIGVLILGLFYEVKKGALNWEK